jgi:hypothetical protein
MPTGLATDLLRAEIQNDPGWQAVNQAFQSATTDQARTEAAIQAAQFLAQHDSQGEAAAVLTTASETVKSRIEHLKQAPPAEAADRAAEQELMTLQGQLDAIKTAQNNVLPPSGGTGEASPPPQEEPAAA